MSCKFFCATVWSYLFFLSFAANAQNCQCLDLQKRIERLEKIVFQVAGSSPTLDTNDHRPSSLTPGQNEEMKRSMELIKKKQEQSQQMLKEMMDEQW